MALDWDHSTSVITLFWYFYVCTMNLKNKHYFQNGYIKFHIVFFNKFMHHFELLYILIIFDTFSLDFLKYRDYQISTLCKQILLQWSK